MPAKKPSVTKPSATLQEDLDELNKAQNDALNAHEALEKAKATRGDSDPKSKEKSFLTAQRDYQDKMDKMHQKMEKIARDIGQQYSGGDVMKLFETFLRQQAALIDVKDENKSGWESAKNFGRSLWAVGSAATHTITFGKVGSNALLREKVGQSWFELKQGLFGKNGLIGNFGEDNRYQKHQDAQMSRSKDDNSVEAEEKRRDRNADDAEQNTPSSRGP